MKNKSFCLNILLLSTLFLSLSGFRSAPQDQPQPASSNESFAGDDLCPPAAYLQDPGDCLPLGPSIYLTDLAKKGISYPFLPLIYQKPDPALTEMPVNIAKVNVFPPDQAPVYNSLEAASTGGTPVELMPAGALLYISYQQWVDVNGGHYFYRANGGWMRASPLSPSAISPFQGLTFTKQPYTSFGWIVETTKPRTAPVWDAPEVNEPLPRETLVQIYDMQTVGDVKWYMVGLNRWIERRYIRQLVIDTTPPDGVTNGRWIEINLYEQTMSVYDNSQLVFASLIATGMDPFFTRPGLFQIKEKKPLESMSGAFAADKSDYYFLEDVPWTMYFDDRRALHAAYWRAFFGYPQSHGCVNISMGDAHWLYDWASVGDWVYVWDPSGLTPTDPSYYGTGGA